MPETSNFIPIALCAGTLHVYPSTDSKEPHLPLLRLKIRPVDALAFRLLPSPFIGFQALEDAVKAFLALQHSRWWCFVFLGRLARLGRFIRSSLFNGLISSWLPSADISARPHPRLPHR
eukprot:3503549-Amphidinium_carterae.2